MTATVTQLHPTINVGTPITADQLSRHHLGRQIQVRTGNSLGQLAIQGRLVFIGHSVGRVQVWLDTGQRVPLVVDERVIVE